MCKLVSIFRAVFFIWIASICFGFSDWTVSGTSVSKREVKNGKSANKFNINATIAEPIRWLLKVANVPLEEERVVMDNWKSIVEKEGFHGNDSNLLALDINGSFGSVTSKLHKILRFLGAKYGLSGDDGDGTNFEVDKVVEMVTYGQAYTPLFGLLIMDGRNETQTEFSPESLQNAVLPIPTFLRMVSDLCCRSTKGDFILGSKLTWGDLVLANWLSIWEEGIDPNILKDFPELQRHKNAVLSLPPIKTWLEAHTT